MKKSFLAVISLFGLIVLISAAGVYSISGKWEVTVQSGHGDFVKVMTFEQDGKNLKISYENQEGEGKMEGTNIEFTIVLQTPMGDLEAEFSGEVKDTEMAGQVSIEGGSMEWTAKKID